MKKIIAFLATLALISPAFVSAAPYIVTQGGTGTSTLTAGQLLVGNGKNPITGTSSPTVSSINTSSTTATSTFAGNAYVKGNLQVDGNFFAPVSLVSSGNATINGILTVTGVSKFADGAVGTPSVTFTADTNTGIYRLGNDILSLVTGGADRLTINASGNVGIGKDPVQNKLEVNGSVEATGDVYGSRLGLNGANGFTGLVPDSTDGDETVFLTLADTERVTLKTNGKVGINNTSPASTLDVVGVANAAGLKIIGGGASPLGVNAQNEMWTGGIGGGGDASSNGEVGGIGGGVLITAGAGGDINDVLAAGISITAGKGGGLTLSAGAGGNAGGGTGTVGGNGGDVKIEPGAKGTGQTSVGVVGNVLVDSARLGGKFGIASSSPVATLSVKGFAGVAPFQIASSTANSFMLSLLQNGRFGVGIGTPAATLDVENTTNGTIAIFGNGTASCTLNGSGLSCASDVRLKRDIDSMSATTTLNLLRALRPVTYRWFTDDLSTTSPPHVGFIAQEVEAIFPEVVSVNDRGYYGINYAEFAPLIVAGLQAIDTRLTTLERVVRGDAPASSIQIQDNSSLGDTLSAAVLSAKDLIVNSITAKKVTTDTLEVNSGITMKSTGGVVYCVTLDDTGNFQKNAGACGIGTTNPSQKLEINGGMRLNTATAKPTCDSTVRGTFWFTQSGAGVKDAVEVCAKDAADAYAWRTIY